MFRGAHNPRVHPLATALAVLVLAVLTIGPTTAAAGGPTVTDEGPDGRGKLLLVLDSSGSMQESDGSGSSKIEAARKALNQVVDGLPSDAQVGMRVYGQSQLSKGDAGACTDSKLVVPVGPGNTDALHRAIARYAPAGETPIAYSLKKAAADLGSDGQRTILLVSDGEETCDPDPCAIARAIAGQGIDLRIDVVGFRVAGKARSQLRCIAEAGHGSYYDAGTGDDLAASLDRLATRAFRPFVISGTPVEGRPDEVGAPEIGVGQYATKIGGKDDERYYVVKKTPGTSLRVSFSLRPPRDQLSDAVAATAETTDGTQCGSPTEASDIGNLNNRQELVSGALLLDVRVDENEKPCVDAATVLLHLQRSRGGDDVVPIEMVVTEEPAVHDVSGLPKGFDTWESKDLEMGFRTGVTPMKVVGGSGFPDATTIADGVYSDGILAGEALIYRVRLDFGQHLESRVRIPRVPPALGRIVGGMGPEVDVIDYGPDRERLPEGSGTAGFVSNARSSTFGVDTPEVRYLNRQGQYDVVGASTAGYYYVAISVARDDDIAGDVIPIQLDVKVVGEPSGQPAYEKPPTASTSPTASPGKDAGTRTTARPDDGSALRLSSAVVGGGIAVVVVVAGVGLLLLRRRHS